MGTRTVMKLFHLFFGPHWRLCSSERSNDGQRFEFCDSNNTERIKWRLKVKSKLRLKPSAWSLWSGEQCGVSLLATGYYRVSKRAGCRSEPVAAKYQQPVARAFRFTKPQFWLLNHQTVNRYCVTDIPQLDARSVLLWASRIVPDANFRRISGWFSKNITVPV